MHTMKAVEALEGGLLVSFTLQPLYPREWASNTHR